MNIAVEGCVHGELDIIYESILNIQRTKNITIDLLICCGDFQAVRDETDLGCLSVKAKYRSMQSFYKYYSGEKTAPCLTVFIGGNHEASNHLRELYYGGWVAPKIYYLGSSGVVNLNGIRIAGMSGIYKSYDYKLGYFERAPYEEKSVFHLRQFDVFKLQQLQDSVDVMISHDWPKGAEKFGNTNSLLRIKPFFRDEIEQNRFGSAPAEGLMKKMRPRYWFSGHMHVKFSSVIPHPEIQTNSSQNVFSSNCTKFLALDKVLPNRDFLQVLRIDPIPSRSALAQGPHRGVLCYDLEWLAILRLTHSHLSWTRNTHMVTPLRSEDIQREMEWLRQRLPEGLEIPRNFSITVTPYRSAKIPNEIRGRNPQTAAFLNSIGLVDHAPDSSSASAAPQIADISTLQANPDEIQVGGEDDEDHDAAAANLNPDEIDVGDIDDDDDANPVEQQQNPDEINLGED